MSTEQDVQINLVIPMRYRNLLRRIAAERMMENPTKNITGTSVATELLMSALDNIEKFDDKDGGMKK